MSNTRDNIPEMDYYELRRQREEYKQRMRMEQNAEKRSAEPASPAQETIEEPVSVQPQPEFVEPRQEAPAARDAFEEAIEEDTAEAAADDDAQDGEQDAGIESQEDAQEEPEQEPEVEKPEEE